MDSVVQPYDNLSDAETAHLERLKTTLGILADLSRADVLLYRPMQAGRAVVVAQARPHTIVPIHSESVVGSEVSAGDEPAVLRALAEGRRTGVEVRRSERRPSSPSQRAPIVQEVYPVIGAVRVVGVLSIETNLIERERHHRRSRVFQRALRQFQAQILAGALPGAERLTPFAEHDGIVYVDAGHRIQYASGIATSLYRKLGYTASLLKRHFEDLELDDSSPVREAFESGTCVEREVRVRDLVWIKKAIPLLSLSDGRGGLLGRREAVYRPTGVLVTICDETEARRQDEEARVKVAMIQEIHHRVKNNMQTIASLLRLQARRAESDEVRQALAEGITRILSVAVIHEFLAHQDARLINIRDVSQRIIAMFHEGVVARAKGIRIDLRGPNIYLPTQPATVCALVINELLQNALEHGFERDEGGVVTVRLQDDGDQITLSVDDDGVGLPPDFDLSLATSLGLQIVRTLATSDLKGRFELHGRDKGVSAVVTFPKQQGGK
jgi:two-component sensor histidine kinase